MKQIKTQPNINALLQDLSETTQETICGGSAGGVNVVLLDGSVKFLGSSLSSTVESTSGGTYSSGWVKVSDGG